MAAGMRNEHAFTLLEMVAVTALISIMLVVAIPRLHSNIFPDSGDETVRWIIANFHQAKENAVHQRLTYVMNISLDTRQLWVAPADLPEAEAAGLRENGYRIPNGVSIDHVALSQADRISSGTVPIAFYPQGHSDKAVIRIRTKNGDRMSVYIEPFLPRVNVIRGEERW